ncbi:hypothetical protein, partial [Bacteroides sp.]|uniref:hypothetical protein n=1 Tax=Bacteroides sp. TaxID=29523 RepID=UPI003A8E0F15
FNRDKQGILALTSSDKQLPEKQINHKIKTLCLNNLFYWSDNVPSILSFVFLLSIRQTLIRYI